MENIESNKIESLIDGENQVEVYAPEEAEEIRKEKAKIPREISKLNNDYIKTHNICLDIYDECFGDLSIEEKLRHIFHHILGGSSGLDEGHIKEFICDENDRKAEKMLKAELEKLKAEQKEKN